MNTRQRICLFLYYHFAIHLPASYQVGGRLSKSFRYALCKRLFKHCGQNVNIEKGARFGTGQNVCVDDNSGIGINADIPDGTHIGKNVMMGPNCYVIGINHKFERLDIPMCNQGYVHTKPLIIEDDCWIGRDVLITGGRTIHKGTIIAARSVLTKDYPDYSIVGGNPARLIKSRLLDK